MAKQPSRAQPTPFSLTSQNAISCASKQKCNIEHYCVH